MDPNFFERLTWGRMNAAFNKLPFRGRLLFFAGGVFVGSGGFAGLALHGNREDATRPPAASDAERSLVVSQLPVLSGSVQRWVGGRLWSSWGEAVAEMLPHSGVLLLGASVANASDTAPTTARDSQPISGGGATALAIPLRGSVVKACHKQSADSGELDKDSLVIELDTAAGEQEFLKCRTAQEYSHWLRELQAASRVSGGTQSDSQSPSQFVQQQRVVDVSYPGHWEAPFHNDRLAPLHRNSKEYKRVQEMVLAQQHRHTHGTYTYVKGRIKVKGISRVQTPRLWEAYCMRRAMIAADNEGDPNEACLWHGTTVAPAILRHGLDPRVCSLSGLFGGGVYLADMSTKSVRYSGAQVKGDSGKLLLCRVSLGRQMVKYLPERELRRPPDPFPLFPSQLQDWWHDRKYHSLFAPSHDVSSFSSLLMNEYIVFHTNQGVPEYVVDFVLV